MPRHFIGCHVWKLESFLIYFYLQLVHAGEAMYLRRIKGSSDVDNLEVKLSASKVTYR